MTDIIELAKEAGVIPHATNIAYMQGDFPQRLERFAALVRAEREWVDLTDDEKGKVWGDWYVNGFYNEELIDRAIADFKEKQK